MKKRFIVVTIIVIIFVLLGGLYWSGYIEFHDYLPTFVPNPGVIQSNIPDELEGAPKLVIKNIKGRFNKISVDIRNIGDQDAKSVNWSVSITGGILKRINLHSTGSINTLAKQSEATVITDRIPLGFGRLNIIVTVEAARSETMMQTARGFKMLFFVIGVRT